MTLRVPVLTYHAIEDGPPPLFTSPQVFANHIRTLKESGYQSITLSMLLNWLTGKAPLPETPMIITFDDGYESVYRHARPILAENGYRAVVFLVGEYCGKTNRWPSQRVDTPERSLMTWEHARELTDIGWEIGAHTLTHPSLPTCSTNDLIAELSGSKRVIFDQLELRPQGFAYPYGALNSAVQRAVSQRFSVAFTAKLGLIRPRNNHHRLPRVDAYYVTPYLLKHLSAFEIYLQFRDILRNIRRLFRTDWKISSEAA